MESESTKEHKSKAPTTVGFGILVISTSVSKGEKDDRSGRLIADSIENGGHKVISTITVPDNFKMIQESIDSLSRDPNIQSIVSTGGTGLTETDITFEAAQEIITKPIPGFHSLFMTVSYEDVGPACMLSRATAGIIENRCVLFCLPGSPKACTLAMEKLILPEVAHITKHFRES